MPLGLVNFPTNSQIFINLITDPKWGLVDRKNDSLGLSRKLDKFWYDAYHQLIPMDLVSEYCHAVAEQINDVLFEHYFDSRPAMWEIARELLIKAGLTEVKTKSQTDFYCWAGLGKSSSELATRMFIGCWH